MISKMVAENNMDGLRKSVSSIIELVGKVIFAFGIFPFTGSIGVILCEPIIWCLMLIQLAVTYYKDPYIISKNLIVNLSNNCESDISDIIKT